MENSMEVPEKIKNRAGKESATMQETWVQSLGWEDPLKKGKATKLYYQESEKMIHRMRIKFYKSYV